MSKVDRRTLEGNLAVSRAPSVKKKEEKQKMSVRMDTQGSSNMKLASGNTCQELKSAEALVEKFGLDPGAVGLDAARASIGESPLLCWKHAC